MTTAASTNIFQTVNLKKKEKTTATAAFEQQAAIDNNWQEGKVCYSLSGNNKIKSYFSRIEGSISLLDFCCRVFLFSGKESYYLFYLGSSFIQLLLWACEMWLSVLLSNQASDSIKAGLRV